MTLQDHDSALSCLVGLGLPEYEAKLYAGKVTEGNMLIVVHCDDDPAKQNLARSVLEAVKAHNISTTTPVPVPSQVKEPG